MKRKVEFVGRKECVNVWRISDICIRDQVIIERRNAELEFRSEDSLRILEIVMLLKMKVFMINGIFMIEICL